MATKRRFENVLEGGEGEEEEAMASPKGDPIRVSGRGRKRRNHYSSFEFNGNVYELEDMVLLSPSEVNEKPYIAVIKDITDSRSGLMVTGQWFYRPEEAIKKGGGTWQAQVSRELFYSFHLDDVPAESIMHKCVVHFVPLNKQLPPSSEHPGFVVRKVYDTVERKLRNLTDTDFEDYKKDELDQLVKKTIERVGVLPDIEPEDASANRHVLRRENTSLIDTLKADGACTETEQLTPAEKSTSCPSNGSEYHAILAKFKALTGDLCRDEWLEKLLQGIQQACEVVALEDNGVMNDEEKIFWPDSAVAAVTALENASHETLGSDFQEYNKEMHLLNFNVKNNALLARRLLNKEWDPKVIITMSPNELKVIQTADAKLPNELEESEDIQMTDTQCPRCEVKQVTITDVIHDGRHGNQYQLECQACGHYWYVSGDAISPLAMENS